MWESQHRNLMRAFGLSLLIGIALYALSIALGDVAAVGAAISTLGWSGWALVLGLSLGNYLLRFVRWRIYIRRLGHRLRLGEHLLIYLGGFAFTTTPGKAGEAVRSLYLKRRGIGYTDSLSALFVERLIDIAAMVLLASLAVLSFEQAMIPVALFAAVILIVLPLLRSAWLIEFLGKLSNRHRGRLRAALEHIRGLLRQSTRLLQARPLYAGFSIALLAWALEAYGLHLILWFMGADVGVGPAMGIYAIAVLVGALSFLPGGLGSTEAAMGLLLSLAGADLAVAVSATLVCRIATLWFAVFIGFGCLGALALRPKTPGSRAHL